jgi:integrase
VSSAWPRLEGRLATVWQRQLLATLTGYGQARGWAPATMLRARRSLTVLLASHPTFPDQTMDAAAVRQFLLGRRQVALRVVEFLIDQGLVGAADQAVLDGWLARRLQPLPGLIRAEVHTWVEALRGRGPRAGRPRKHTTIQGYVRALEAALADWSAHYQSLRQVTTHDVAAQLVPLTGPTRLLTLAAMRSLFGTLKARRVLFANPTAGLVGRHVAPRAALGLDPTIRASLLGQLDRPDERLVVLLAGVHALRCGQICALGVDAVDLAAGTLAVDRRPRRLDALTLEQARAWLELRSQRWPTSANPYLLINQSTAGGCKPVKRSFVHQVFQRLGTTAHQLRVDRIMAEVHTSGGDPRTLTGLFGLSDPTAIRYCAELGPLDQANPKPQQPPKFGELTAGDHNPDLQ